MPLNDNSQDSLDAECLTPEKMYKRELVCVFTTQIILSYPNPTPPVAYLPPEADLHVYSSSSAPAPAPAPAPTPTTAPYPTLTVPPNPYPSQSTLCPLIWRENYYNRGTWTNTLFQDEIFYYSIVDPPFSYQYEILSYHTSIDADFQTGLLNGSC